MTFGEKIKLHRKILNLSQRQLAEKAGLFRNQIQSYESDTIEPSVFKAGYIAQALGLSLDYLLDYNPPKNIIIHCKNCKYYYEQNKYIHTCSKNMCKILNPDDFCSDAEAK